jgi:hypothetical protein
MVSTDVTPAPHASMRAPCQTPLVLIALWGNSMTAAYTSSSAASTLMEATVPRVPHMSPRSAQPMCQHGPSTHRHAPCASHRWWSPTPRKTAQAAGGRPTAPDAQLTDQRTQPVVLRNQLLVGDAAEHLFGPSGGTSCAAWPRLRLKSSDAKTRCSRRRKCS